MDQNTFESVVEHAKYAPSAHNAQPARWSLLGNGSILISADLSCRLSVGDPDDRDLLVSCGAAIEGTILSLAKIGIGAEVDFLSTANNDDYRTIAVVTPKGSADPDDVKLSEYVLTRTTHRLGFIPSPAPKNLTGACVTIVKDVDQIDWVSNQIDIAASKIMKQAPFRAELLTWMRLSKRDKRYHIDGLNKDALGLSWAVAKVTPLVLGTWIFRLLSICGLGPAVSGESTKSKGSAAILLFHWPKDRCMLEAGRLFYRHWLHVSSCGFAAWPAAALADDEETASQIKDRFSLPKQHILFNALRVGIANQTPPANTRMPVTALILPKEGNQS